MRLRDEAQNYARGVGVGPGLRRWGGGDALSTLLRLRPPRVAAHRAAPARVAPAPLAHRRTSVA
jgi:hypothetical protein